MKRVIQVLNNRSVLMDLDEKIFNFAYEFALRDATLQNAYTGSLDVLRENAESCSCIAFACL